MTLTRSIDLTSSDREVWTYPAGTDVTVHHFTGQRCAVVVDGRVYRSCESDVSRATS